MCFVDGSLKGKRSQWQFSEEVAHSFPSHIEKSIFFYHEGHTLIEKLSDFFCHQNSTGCDLGCSTGMLLRKLSKRHKQKNTQWIGIDSSKPMIDKAKQESLNFPLLKWVLSDLASYQIPHSSIIISYYSLQFIPKYKRASILSRIYQALETGGAFIFFEKVLAPSAQLQDIMARIYADYKEDRGFSGNEILAKEQSLRGVLDAYTDDDNLNLLKQAGFKQIMTIYKYVCFQGVLCIK